MNIRTGYIRLICAKRGIRNLVHFTRAENLGGIAKHGLVPRWMMSRITSVPSAPIVNEEYRLDGHWDAVCLSIEFPDYTLFERYRARDPAATWVVLELNPSLLWEADSAFCWTNAGAPQIRSVSVPQLRTTNSLSKMFAPPTNPRAEILIFGTIAPRYITGVCFETSVDMKAYGLPSPGLPEPQVKTSYFQPRSDHERWKNAVTGDAALSFLADQTS